MAVEKVGINLDALNNLSEINISIPSTNEGIVTAIEQAGVNYLNGWYGISITVTLLLILFWALTDDSPESKFRYTYLRGLNLALTMCTIFISVLISIGYTNNYYGVTLFGILTMITSIMVLGLENQG